MGAAWGTVADWVAAISTGGALLLTAVVLLRDRVARDRAQAEQVVVFTQYSVGQTDDATDLDRVIVVQNGSGNAAFDTFVTSEVPPDGQLYVMVVGTLGPGESREISAEHMLRGRPGADMPRTHVSFMDAHGRRWLKEHLGPLRRVRSRPWQMWRAPLVGRGANWDSSPSDRRWYEA